MADPDAIPAVPQPQPAKLATTSEKKSEVDDSVESGEPISGNHSQEDISQDEAEKGEIKAPPPDANKLQDQTNLLPMKQVLIIFAGLSCALFCKFEIHSSSLMRHLLTCKFRFSTRPNYVRFQTKKQHFTFLSGCKELMAVQCVDRSSYTQSCVQPRGYLLMGWHGLSAHLDRVSAVVRSSFRHLRAKSDSPGQHELFSHWVDFVCRLPEHDYAHRLSCVTLPSFFFFFFLVPGNSARRTNP